MQSERALKSQSRNIVIKTYGNEDINKISQLELLNNEIQVWVLLWRKLGDWIKTNWNIMELSEKEYVIKYVFRDDRLRSAAGKILTRKLLIHYMNTAESQIDILRGKFGKPFLNSVSSEKLNFSVSHSGEVVLVGITRNRLLGIDVEIINYISDYKSIAQHFFTGNEWNKIKNSKDERLFFDYWTAKEAYVKATGDGLSRSLNSFEIRKNNIIDDTGVLNEWKREVITVLEGYAANLVFELNGKEEMI